MTDKGIYAQARDDLAEVFNIVTTRGEKMTSGGVSWHRFGDVDAIEGSAVRMIDTFDGSVSASKLTSAVSYEGNLGPSELRALASLLRKAP